MDKEAFLLKEYIPLLKKLTGTEKGQWGLLSPQGMIEHMTDSIGIAWERIKEPLQTPVEHVEKMKAFALSDKEFKPSTKNSLMPETPAPLRNTTMADALIELEYEIQKFANYYKVNNEAVVINPFFGPLNYPQWIQLLHKHAIHHLKQFNLL